MKVVDVGRDRRTVREHDIVSILVVVDEGRRHRRGPREALDTRRVSILVVVDEGRRRV